MLRTTLATAAGALTILLTSTAWGQSPEPAVVARVAQDGIPRTTFDHWLGVVARSDRQAIPAKGTEAWGRLRDQVMTFLVTGKWVVHEARKRGIHVTAAALRRAFVRTRRQAFKTRAAYRRFLRRTGMTNADALYRVRVDVLNDRLRARVTGQYRSKAAKQRALDIYLADFTERWTTQTLCAEDYLVGECSDVLPAA